MNGIYTARLKKILKLRKNGLLNLWIVCLNLLRRVPGAIAIKHEVTVSPMAARHHRHRHPHHIPSHWVSVSGEKRAQMKACKYMIILRMVTKFEPVSLEHSLSWWIWIFAKFPCKTALILFEYFFFNKRTNRKKNQQKINVHCVQLFILGYIICVWVCVNSIDVTRV